MVVEYNSGAEGSCWSFFTQTPYILSRCRGSALPLVFPQICIAIGLSFVAKHLTDIDANPFDGMDAPVSLGILVTFMLVFKTQNSYGQFWSALTALDGVLQTSRIIAMTSCTLFEWDHPSDKSNEVRVRARRIVRLLVLHYFVIVEFFQRSGANSTTDVFFLDLLRQDIRRLTGENEFSILYPDEPVDTHGSESKHETANPLQVLFWIQLALGRVVKVGACPPPIASGFIGDIHRLMDEVAVMNKIDKTQFPLPYAQIVKILVMVWVFTLPFFIVSGSGSWTPIIASLAALGFFGLDEVAEILESPFGNDPNDIFLRQYGIKLMSDLEMMYNGRDTKLDDVFSNERDLNFSELLKSQFHMTHSDSSLDAVKKTMSASGLTRGGSKDRIVAPAPEPNFRGVVGVSVT